MKNLVLLFTSLLMALTTVTAAEKQSATTKQGKDLSNASYNFAQPILFVERGVEFLIFPDGSFDFNTNLDYTHGDTYYRTRNVRSRGNKINQTFGAPGTRVHYATSRRPRGTVIKHDRDGKIRRIGNVFVNYNRIGQVKRLGSVYINYNRSGLVKQIGGLNIRYNRRGMIIGTSGFVNYSNQNCGICGLHACNDNHFGNSNNYTPGDYHSNNDDYYYYKKGGKIKKQKKIKS
ncbi:MAG: hypothetical protein ACPG6B_09045 [Oceanihabitans sp.]